jgi:hypothetical protein
MPRIPCGAGIQRFGSVGDPGTIGCLVRFPDVADAVFLLTAGHVLVTPAARQFDPVEALDLPHQRFGMLQGWTGLGGPTTTDAALVHVDPALIDAAIGALGAPGPINTDLNRDMPLRIFAKGRMSTGRIMEPQVDRDLQTQTGIVTYRDQILCTCFSEPGCSGAIAVDANNRPVGMVIGGNDLPERGETFTLLTPIKAILEHPDWGNGPALELLDHLPQGMVAPSAALPAVPVAAIAATDQATDILARTLWAEDRSGGGDGMRAVASVILNRLRAGQPHRWGATVEAVCQREKQFSCWNDGRLGIRDMKSLQGNDLAMWRLACGIAGDAIKGRLGADPTDGARHYVATSLIASCNDPAQTDRWYCRSRERVAIQDQTYYRNVP